MDETSKMESHLSSAAAFVEGGIQDACDDACSICLEAFSEGDPSTVTGCEHEFHLQCILEWCQRSSQCPMCCQPISFKDPTSQELLEAVERERNLQIANSRNRNAAIFYHPSFGDLELQHLPIGANDAELEERIFQHLAAAAAMGRAHLARREGRRGRSGTHGRPQYLVFSADANAIPTGTVAASSAHGGLDNEMTLPSASGNHTALLSATGENLRSQVPHHISIGTSQAPISTSETDNASLHNRLFSSGRSSSIQISETDQDRAGPSDFQSFSESLRSRINAMSMKYKESMTKATRGWRERFFSRSTHATDAASENRAEVVPPVACLPHAHERLHPTTTTRQENASEPQNLEGHLVSEATSTAPNELHENTQRGLTPLE